MEFQPKDFNEKEAGLVEAVTFSRQFSATGLNSNPPQGKYKITNIYVDPATGKLVVEYSDIPQP